MPAVNALQQNPVEIAQILLTSAYEYYNPEFPFWPFGRAVCSPVCFRPSPAAARPDGFRREAAPSFLAC
jgi:hypothetical protein